MRQLVLIAYWTALCVATHLPPSKVRVPGNNWDLFIHAAAFGGLAALAALATRGKHLMTWWLILACYAGLDEWTQGWVGRSPDGLDWLADVIGISAALRVVRLWTRRS